MKRILIAVLFSGGLAFNSVGQTSNNFKSSIIHAEVFGYSLNQISINYEGVFSDSRPVKIGVRGGVGIDGLLFNTDYDRYALMAGAFGFIGQQSSHFEFGTGLSYLKGSFVDVGAIPNSTIYLPINVSYRFQKPLKPLFFKVGVYQFVKLIDLEELPDYETPKLTYTFGVAIGYAIVKKQNRSEGN